MPFPEPISCACRLPRAAARAGASPHSSVVSSVTPIVAHKASRLNRISISDGNAAIGIDLLTHWIPRYASRPPIAVAVMASMKLSANNCCIRRPRDAPRPARSASSPRRLAVRASSRFATLLHAIMRSRKTAPPRMYTISLRLCDVYTSASDLTVTANCGGYRSGYSLAWLRAMTSTSAAACCRETPGLRRA